MGIQSILVMESKGARATWEAVKLALVRSNKA